MSFTKIAGLALWLVSASAIAAGEKAPPATYPHLVKRARSSEDFVPKGWSLESKTVHDLNGDGRPDAILVLRGTDPRLVIRSHGPGSPSLNTNPRILAGILADQASADYLLAFEDHALIPRHDTPTIDDLFDGISAEEKGGFRLGLRLWANAGSWTTSQASFAFRFQDGCFRLIGYDRSETHRASLETTSVSVNYLSGKAKITSGNEGTGESRNKWETLSKKPKICLEHIGNGWEFDPKLSKLAEPPLP